MNEWWIDSLTPPPSCLDLPPVSIEATFCVLVMRDREGRIFVAATGPGGGGGGVGDGETFLARVMNPDGWGLGSQKVPVHGPGCPINPDSTSVGRCTCGAWVDPKWGFQYIPEVEDDIRKSRLSLMRTLFEQLGAWIGGRVEGRMEQKAKGGNDAR